MSSLTGKNLKDRYQVNEFLGRGGMAEVYKVWDSKRMTFLAMKVLHEDLALDKIFMRRFQREAQTLAKLQHPNIVRFFGLEQDDRRAFMLLDFIEGETLKSQIFDAKGSMPLGQIRKVMRSLCGALQFAHSEGLVHCDIKPGNVMVDKHGKVLLSDFGIARMTDAATATMVGMGTPAYMAPEQARGLEPLPQTDIYALGVVLFEMLTGGERPFTGELSQATGSTSEKVRWEQVNLEPPSIHRWNPDISPELEALVLNCLEKDPEKRYVSALDLLNALELALEDVSELAEEDVDKVDDGEAEESDQDGHPRKVALISVIAILVIGLIIGGFSFVMKGRDGLGPFAFLASATPTSVPTATLTATLVPSATATPSPTPSPTNTTIPTSTATPTNTVTPTLAPQFAWVHEVLHQEQAIGYWTSLVIDNDDEIHITYFQDNYDMVWYAHTENGQWETRQQVRGGIGAGFNTSLSLDSEGYPHIAYNSYKRKGVTPRLHYDFWDGSQWKGYFRNPDYRLWTYADVSVALGPDDVPHFVFMEDYASNVVYSTYNGGQFENYVVGKGIKNAKSLSLVIDESRNPHLVFQHTDDGLVYATLRAGNWYWEAVDSSSGAGIYSDLTLDSSGNPHIAYYNGDDTNLYYAYKTEKGWQTQLVDDDGDVGYFASIEVDSEGHIHIGYQDISENNLKYAHGRNGSWDIYLVDDDGDVGSFLSLGVDSQGIPYISYQDMEREDLKFARAMPKYP